MWPVIVLLQAGVCVSGEVVGYLSVNAVNVGYTAVGETFSTRRYDFFDDELVNIRCNALGHSYYLQLSYSMKANRTLSTDPKIANHVEMFIKLTADNDGAYVDCYITDTVIPTDVYVIRLRFKYKMSTETAILWMQGLSLTPRLNEDGQTWLYKYEYYDKEIIEMASLMDEQKYGQMYCGFDGKNTRPIKYNMSTWDSNKPFLIMSRNNDKINVKCSIGKEPGMENLSILVELVPRPIENNRPFITGLPMAHTLVDFLKNESDHIILYDYEATNKLFIECYTQRYAEWYLNCIFELKSNQLSSVISCKEELKEAKDKSHMKIHVELVRRKNKGVMLAGECPVPAKKESTTSQPQHLNHHHHHHSAGVIFASCGAAVAVMVVIAISTTVILRKKKQSAQNVDQAETTYVSNPKHNKGAMLVPRQKSRTSTAKTNMYSGPQIPNLNEMYSKPVAKSQRRPKELQYAELEINEAQENEEDAAYATVGMNEGPTGVVKKEIGHDNYIHVLHKNSRDDQTYVNCDANKYANSFDATYTNARHINDYVEPAYCEINVRK